MLRSCSAPRAQKRNGAWRVEPTRAETLTERPLRRPGPTRRQHERIRRCLVAVGAPAPTRSDLRPSPPPRRRHDRIPRCLVAVGAPAPTAATCGLLRQPGASMIGYTTVT